MLMKAVQLILGMPEPSLRRGETRSAPEEHPKNGAGAGHGSAGGGVRGMALWGWGQATPMRGGHRGEGENSDGATE